MSSCGNPALSEALLFAGRSPGSVRDWARGEEYARIRDAAAPADTLENLVSALRRMQHPTVWREMLRQRARIPEPKVLFAEVPGALGW